MSKKPEGKLKDLRIKSFWIWVGTVVNFGLFTLLGQLRVKGMSNLEAIFFFLDIGVGIVAFIVMVLSYLIKPKTKEIKNVNKGVNGLSLAAIIILFMPIVALAGPIIEEQKANYEKQRIILPSFAPSIASPFLVPKNTQPTNNIGSTIDCIGPDGKQFKTTMNECKNLNEKWGKPLEYMVSCTISKECGGGIKYMKKSDCENQTCCHLNNGTYVLLPTLSSCKNYYSNNPGGSGSNFAAKKYYPCTLCYHSSGQCTTYNYLVETKEACDTEQEEINSLGSSYVLPTNTSAQSTTTTNPTNNAVDTSACYSQYNSDIQAAKMYGGNVGSAMTDMAKSNLNRCLSSGQVTAVGTVQQDTRPRDRNGKLCSEYGSEVLSYSQSMGCP